MKRAANVSAVLLAFALASTGASGQQRPETGKPRDGEVVTLRGCVSGSLLKSVRADPATVTGALTGSDRYRMIAPREVKRQLKRANGALVDITGRIKPGPRAMVKGKKFGKTTIGVGITQGVTSPLDQRVDETPTVEVDAVEVVAPRCDA